MQVCLWSDEAKLHSIKFIFYIFDETAIAVTSVALIVCLKDEIYNWESWHDVWSSWWKLASVATYKVLTSNFDRLSGSECRL